MEYHINIGTNMGNREENLSRAREALRQQFSDIRFSRIVESEPWGFESDNGFLNQGGAFKFDYGPEVVLTLLQHIEEDLSGTPHRNEDGSYRDREVDIDIVDWEGEPYNSERVTIPHRHLSERPFFLEPLEELRSRRQIVLKGREVLLWGDDFPTARQISAIYPAGEIFSAGPCDGWRVTDDWGEPGREQDWFGSKEDPEVLPEGCRWVDQRDAWRVLGDEKWAQMSRIAELTYWDRETQFCGRCGTRMKREGEVSKRCPHCGAERFPRLSPAIVVLVRKGEEALLVHGRALREGVHALVAGFVETGESLEETVRREVREETGLEIDDIQYFGSQSWPFPAQLMIGFTARWVSGEPRWVDGELTTGGFFGRDNLPKLPSPPSLTRRIIDAWLYK